MLCANEISGILKRFHPVSDEVHRGLILHLFGDYFFTYPVKITVENSDIRLFSF